MREDSAQLAAARERYRFAARALRDAQNTLALVRQSRVDAMGAPGTHAEQRALYVIEESLARRRVNEWTDRVATLRHTLEFFGQDPDA